MESNLSDILYTSQYCEENVFNILKSNYFTGSHALFISNAARTVLLDEQKAGGAEGRVCWDYHVVAINLKFKYVLDRDSTLPLPTPIQEYFNSTFPKPIPSNLRSQFRLVSSAEMENFASDRSHMFDDSTNTYYAPAPNSALCRGKAATESHNLDKFISMEDEGLGFGQVFNSVEDLLTYLDSMEEIVSQ